MRKLPQVQEPKLSQCQKAAGHAATHSKPVYCYAVNMQHGFWSCTL